MPAQVRGRRPRRNSTPPTAQKLCRKQDVFASQRSRARLACGESRLFLRLLRKFVLDNALEPRLSAVNSQTRLRDASASIRAMWDGAAIQQIDSNARSTRNPQSEYQQRAQQQQPRRHRPHQKAVRARSDIQWQVQQHSANGSHSHHRQSAKRTPLRCNSSGRAEPAHRGHARKERTPIHSTFRGPDSTLQITLITVGVCPCHSRSVLFPVE